MFSKEEAALLRKDFWTSFGKSFPRKWLLYNTKIKGFSFKFVAERKQAMVCIDIENPDELVNLLYYDQMLSLKTLLETELPEVIFNDAYELESGKIIHRIYVPFEGKFSVYNKNSWRDCFEFYMETMPKFELFFYEYEDIIKNI
ncbi:DUF4268 domain-containing protein [Polaribacter sp. Z014]|uniref:DUF4268 domain-containing protein n=1 Tax=unclassified Polaribacter TaxID=196858 RepID=UPI00193B4975|nr:MULTISPECIES: DUF4268 domain-containing protein [unclassified Polaribacter]MCL7762689.1 DUF4268 domain-containing protein [Polaribacter sp. Z014]QVY66171.1 DUF4268 domain-containing protein [Polaribacter sp. Q13]